MALGTGSITCNNCRKRCYRRELLNGICETCRYFR